MISREIMSMTSRRPIIVLGCPRSGTTLLSALLNAHPNIAMPPETRFLLPAYENRKNFGDLELPANRRRLAEQITGPGSKFKDLRLDRETVIQAIVDAPPTLGSAFARIWQEYARARGARRWGEKRPAYWREMDVVLRLFPTAQIIHLIRDPRACVASLRQVRWWKRSVPYSAAFWRVVDAEVDKVGRRLTGDSYYQIRYEDLIDDVPDSLQRLCAFLEEDFSPAMLSHTDAARDIVPNRKTWHERVAQPVDRTRANVWRETLAPEEIGLIEMMCRRRMTVRGYRPSQLGHRPPTKDVVEFLEETAKIRAWLANRRLKDAHVRRQYTTALAAVT
jgi:hypothetical protein